MGSPDPPPFDAVKACFYLIAFVIGIHCFVVLIGVGFCFWHGVEYPQAKCDVSSKLMELLSGALAAALAFAGGRTRDKQ